MHAEKGSHGGIQQHYSTPELTKIAPGFIAGVYKSTSDPVSSHVDGQDDRVWRAIAGPAYFAKEAVARSWLPLFFQT